MMNQNLEQGFYCLGEWEGGVTSFYRMAYIIPQHLQCDFFANDVNVNSTSEICTALRRSFPKMRQYNRRILRDGQISFIRKV